MRREESYRCAGSLQSRDFRQETGVVREAILENQTDAHPGKRELIAGAACDLINLILQCGTSVSAPCGAAVQRRQRIEIAVMAVVLVGDRPP